MIDSMWPHSHQADTWPYSAFRIIEDGWDELSRGVFVQRQLGIAPTRLPDVSFGEAQRRSAVGRSLLSRIDALEQTILPHNLALTLRLLRFRALTWSREADWYWIASDAHGAGVFFLFHPSGYCGGQLLTTVHGQLSSFSFIESGDADRYLGLISDYARLIDQFTTRTAGQAERGIRMPKVQVQQARALLTAFRSGARANLGVVPERLAAVSVPGFPRELEIRIARQVEPAFDRALAGLSDTYLAEAPDAVGLGQYPGGAELYAQLVKHCTTQDLTPEQVHERGHARMAQIEDSMRRVRAEIGFKGDRVAFLAHLENDPRWRAPTVESITAVFQRYIDRLKPRIGEYFPTPKATYGVAPLSEALEGSMTFGYYESPRRDHAEGTYYFNPRNMTTRELLRAGALTYHELMPGHHLHLSIQLENEDLHPFCTYSHLNAYNEGWAEYAAAFAGEIGLYEQPEERYGLLMSDAFLTCRLVVDTGMNALGWSLKRAREYMRTHSEMTEAVIATESLRYSCDMPGQALAYKLGDTQIFAMRERMRLALGTQFDVKEFHSAVLGRGALPLPDLEWHMEHEIERLKRDRKS